MLAWLTPDSTEADGVTHCRLLAVPTEYLSAVNGALGMLAQAWNWETYGDVTPAQAAEAMSELIEDYYMSEACRIGTLFHYITDTAPDGALACDGSTYNDGDYPDLAGVIAPAFDNGDGTFTLPDLRGRVLLGAGAGAGLSNRSVGDAGGVETHQLVESEIPSHFHTTHTHAIGLDVESAGVPDLSSSPPLPSEITGSTGGDQPHENMPPFVALPVAVWYR